MNLQRAYCTVVLQGAPCTVHNASLSQLHSAYCMTSGKFLNFPIKQGEQHYLPGVVRIK